MAERVVIIGSGPAGWSAAIYASRASLDPLVFEGAQTEENRMKGTLPLGQLSLTTEVENYPGFPAGDVAPFLKSALPEHLVPYRGKNAPHGITGPELMELMRQQAKNFGARVITDDVVSVDLSVRPFRLTSLEGRQIEAHTLIIATGARANYLGLESEERFKNRGVSACAVCDGALPRFRNKPLVVIGGGDTAMEEASYLTKFASTVYLVHRRDEFRASKIMSQRVIENPKINVQWSSAVVEVLGTDDDGVTGVKLKNLKTGDVQTLEAAGMFAAIGHTPNTDFLKGQVETDDKGYIVWKEMFRTRTSVEGVYAAGDVADSNYRQAITSAGTGCMAALDAERWLALKGLH
ncbi:MAG: thioredoxin-disulfide reductase [Planctomycetaceae bacterium]|nr:thioredoxin-disulfide reductase [Planctomycetaceae bacterium]